MESYDRTEQVQRIVEFPIVNRGFSRYGATPLKRSGLLYLPTASDTLYRDVQADPWETFQWWESPLQAQAGIGMLARHPFLRLHRGGMDQQEILVPTRMLYPYALRTSETSRIERAAATVAAGVRQAREMYTAAAAAGVTDLGRPLLYFYGALSLATAATAALFGANALERAHGLGTGGSPTASSDRPQWPTLIEWQGDGHFPMLYHTTWWDELYACCTKDSRWQGKKKFKPPLRFHVLECIRALQYPWGMLPPTGLPTPGTAQFDAQMRSGLLLPYQDGGEMYMRNDTALDVPLVEVPRVVVQYMLLYYFSILARYHPVEWQRLLAADREPEGYVFRVAMERVAHDYASEIARLLPTTPPPWAYMPQQWATERPNLDDGLYIPPSVVVGSPPGPRMYVYTLDEWDNDPQDRCAKTTDIERTSTRERKEQSGT